MRKEKNKMAAGSFEIELEKYYSTGADEFEAKNGNRYIVFYCYGKDVRRKVKGNATTSVMCVAENVSFEDDDCKLFGTGVWLDIEWSRNNGYAKCITVRMDQSSGK